MSDTGAFLPPDYHTHTALCGHGFGWPVEYARAAKALGLPGIAATDHCPTPDRYDLEHRMVMAQYGDYADAVRNAQAEDPGYMLLGVEADYYPGCESFLRAWLSGQPLDIVLGSIHFLDYWAFDDPAQRTLWDSADVDAVWRRYFALVRELAETRLFDLAAHLDLPKKFGHRPEEAKIREWALPALDAMAAAGMAVEINTSGAFHAAAAFYPSLPMLSWARERDIPLTFGSDAHRPEHVGSRFADAVEWARQAGYTTAVRFKQRERQEYPLP